MTERRLAALVEVLWARGRLTAGPSLDLGAEPGPVIRTVAYDSRRVVPGALFVALRGRLADGHDHASEAVGRGAVAVIAEAEIPDLGVPQVLVGDTRAALAIAAAWQTGFPSHDLGVVGVTGTDGKTTTAYLIRAILEAGGDRCGLVSTTDVVAGGRSVGNPSRATTPEAPELQGYLAAMRAAGDRWAVVESTSHGLAQQRVGEIAYDVAVLTNVTREHLEFHGSPEAYVAAKQGLFHRLAVGPENPEKGFGKHAVINADDPHAATFAGASRAAAAAVVSYGLGPDLGGRGSPPPDIRAEAVVEDPSGMRVTVRTPRWRGIVRLRLAGRFNIHNALAALGVAEGLGQDAALAAEALSSVTAVPGRMQRVDAGQPFSVVIDYAHTVASLEKVLDELKPTGATGGLIVVFGSAGERDTQKRPAMGQVAGERCRLVIVTNEDPRREDPEAIIEAIAQGAERAGQRRGRDLLLIVDRREAIGVALARAQAGDVVVLAGKGHERSIEMADGAHPWDEVATAREALEAAGFRTDPGRTGVRSP